jgi:hypothetical protein
MDCIPHIRFDLIWQIILPLNLNQWSKCCFVYLLIAKNWANQLSIVGKPVDDEGLISNVVGGLKSSYHSFITSLSFATQDATISFHDF